MRLLSLDYEPVYGDDDVTLSSFSGDVTVFDYDIVIWDPAATLNTYSRYRSSLYKGLPSLSESTSFQLRADATRRKKEFADFVNAGRVLVVISRPPQECYIDTGARTYSGTGRNRAATVTVEPFDLLSAIPVSGLQFSRARGTRIEFNGSGPLVSLLRKYKSLLEYETLITDEQPGKPLAHVSGTDKAVAVIRASKAGGYLILLPAINLEVPYEEGQELPEGDDRWRAEASVFQSDLTSAIEQLNGVRSASRPAWAELYFTDKQQHLSSEVVKQQARIETARVKLARLQLQKDAAESRSQLYLGSGRALELEVKNVLERLGGTVTEAEPGRADWRVSFPEGDAVVEVKGVGKSAAERHAAQLEKWVSESLEETGNRPKGILVVNTWRETPLGERTREDFPEQMLPYSQVREHCLITGLQIFIILADVEGDSKKAKYWRKKLMETSGTIGDCDDWRAVIREAEAKE